MAKEFICARCHSVGKPKSVVKGTFLVELGLWLLLLLPVIYLLANEVNKCVGMGCWYEKPASVAPAIWVCFLLPGLLYTLWRLSSKHTACSVCESVELLPLNSPRGQELLSQEKP
jgi:hypothetical protein